MSIVSQFVSNSAPRFATKGKGALKELKDMASGMAECFQPIAEKYGKAADRVQGLLLSHVAAVRRSRQDNSRSGLRQFSVFLLRPVDYLYVVYGGPYF